MRISLIKLGVLITCTILTVLFTGPIYENHEKYAKEKLSHRSETPAVLSRIIAGEFKGIVADYYQFKVMTYMGMKLLEQTPPTFEEWDLMYHICLQATHLDARFWDPYQFAEMMLAWQARMITETNSLLIIAAKARPRDFRPYYYLGFNYFYFKKKLDKGAHYMRLAGQQPNAPTFLKGLASRLSVYGNQTRLGIAFLKDLLATTSDPQIKSYFEKRIETLKKILLLEITIQKYKKNFHRSPASLQDLIDEKLITAIPDDPYGGKFILLPNDRVYTTSELIEQKTP